MICRDCKHLRSKRVGYVSSVYFCGVLGDKGRGKGIGVYPWLNTPHPKCPLKNNKTKGEMEIMSTDTKVITGKCRLSYVHVFEPHSIDGGEAKYSVSVLIPKSDKATLKKIKAAIEAAQEAGKSKWGGKIPKNLKTPLRDGDEEREDDPAYEGHYFLKATSKNKPGIIDRNREEIIDSTEVYSGCYARLSLNFYAFDVSGNRGIACGLNNIQKWADGDYLGGRSKATDDFDEIEDDEDEDFLG